MSERSTIYRFVSNAYQMIVAMGMLAATSCGGSTGPTTTSTTTTTASATTTTTAPVTTTTTSTTTTSIPVLTGSISVQNTPCTATATAPVSCTFVGNASGGQAPYTFTWIFRNPANNATVQATGQQVRPQLGCDIAVGVQTFNVSLTLTIQPASGSSITVTGTQQIVRAAGNCGV